MYNINNMKVKQYENIKHYIDHCLNILTTMTIIYDNIITNKLIIIYYMCILFNVYIILCLIVSIFT